MTFPRWLRNPIWWAVGLAVLLIALPLARFSAWRADRLEQLERGSELRTLKAGKIEFAQAGKGPRVLVIHGSPGGYDQGMAIATPLIEAGFAVVAPSRPGYLRTPLVSGILVSQQAELMGQLMDQLGAEPYSIVAFGEGAHAALALAAAHPDRVQCVVLFSPVLHSRSWPQILNENRLPGWAINQALTGDMGAWLFAEQVRWQPAKALERAFALTTTLKPFDQFTEAEAATKDPVQRERFRHLADSITPVSRREVGIRNDVVLSLAYSEIDLGHLKQPLFVVRGQADAFTDSADVASLLQKAPQATLREAARTGYLSNLGPESAETLKQVVEFLRATP